MADGIFNEPVGGHGGDEGEQYPHEALSEGQRGFVLMFGGNRENWPVPEVPRVRNEAKELEWPKSEDRFCAPRRLGGATGDHKGGAEHRDCHQRSRILSG